ncbi:MAG: phosphoglycolate phosphatase [Gammaproteobacteria bacterium]
MIRAVLFDLDGTLLDTAPDLGYALNTLLKQEGREPLSFEHIRPIASHGSLGLLHLGFNITPADSAFKSLREQFLALYQAHIADKTTVFPGIEEVLLHLENQGIPWGIVTNKPAALTTLLLKKINLYHRAACIISGDTLPQCKPHPAPLLHACKLMNQDPTHCLYLGDAERDIQAGKRAHMKTLITAYGYISDADDIHAWKADGIIYSPEESLKWITI